MMRKPTLSARGLGGRIGNVPETESASWFVPGAGSTPDLSPVDSGSQPQPWVSCVLLVGIAVLPFLPETKDQPLPE
jgi:hypothetical protein